jgi:predicted glycoside hydrolase/deacetylase ChbG (UPF0249 family)
MMADPSLRPIWLCADDYGISRSVSKAIRDLVAAGRLNATSVMVVAPNLDRPEAAALNMLNAGSRRVAIGLHVTLTGPFEPASPDYRPTRGGAFLRMPEMLARGSLRLLRRKPLAAEITAQVQAFTTLFGRTPDFIDGHQHVHLFPQVRSALIEVVGQLSPRSWVRQCGRAPSAPQSAGDRKGLLLDALSRRFRRMARRAGIKTNPAFAGTYSFNQTDDFDYAKVFPGFLAGLPADGVVMCHPGFVDAELERLDPLTTLREREYAYFLSDAFQNTLRAHGVALAAA